MINSTYFLDSQGEQIYTLRFNEEEFGKFIRDIAIFYNKSFKEVEDENDRILK